MVARSYFLDACCDRDRFGKIMFGTPGPSQGEIAVGNATKTVSIDKIKAVRIPTSKRYLYWRGQPLIEIERAYRTRTTTRRGRGGGGGTSV